MLALAVLLAASCTPGDDDGDDGAPRTTATTATAGPPGFGDDMALARVPVAEGPAIAAMTPTPTGTATGGFVAVGGDRVWVTGDGTAWSQHPETPALVGTDLAAVTTVDRLVVAAGRRGADGVVVVSDDAGASWRPAVTSAATFADAAIEHLHGVGRGVVATGVAASGAATVWISLDGDRWRRAPAAGLLATAPSWRISGVAASGGGALVATATRSPSVGGGAPVDPTPVVWRSDDGLRWEPSGSGLPNAVTAAGPVRLGDLLLVGGSDGTDAAAWISLDGLRWTGVDHDESVLGGDDEQAMTAVGGGGVVTGVDGVRPAAWRVSCRGPCRVQRIEVQGGGRLAAGDNGRNGVLVVGAAADGTAAAWRNTAAARSVETSPTPPWSAAALDERAGTARGVATTGGRLVAVGSVDGADGAGRDAVAWLSDDGRRWRPAVIEDGTGDQSADAVVATPTGLIAVGSVVGPAGPDDADAAVWESDDGSTWSRTPDGPSAAFGGPGRQHATAVGVRPDGDGDGDVVVVGDDDALGTLDGAAWVRISAGWNRAATDSLGFGGIGAQSVRAVAASPGGSWLAAGVETVASGLDVVVWRSADGGTWDRTVPRPASFGGLGDQAATTVVADGDAVVVGGYLREAPAQPPDAALWSGGAGPWSRTPGPWAGAGAQAVHGLTSTPSMVVAAGLAGADAAVWIKSGGAPWRRVSHNEAVFGGDGEQYALAVIAASGRVVAVGASAGRPVAWEVTLGD